LKNKVSFINPFTIKKRLQTIPIIDTKTPTDLERSLYFLNIKSFIPAKLKLNKENIKVTVPVFTY